MQPKTGKSVQREATSARSGADLVCSEGRPINLGQRDEKIPQISLLSIGSPWVFFNRTDKYVTSKGYTSTSI